MSIILPKERLNTQHDIDGKVAWRSPSNIALIKYWGKRPIQLPANASISFTLSEAFTETSISFTNRTKTKEWISFSFEGKKEVQFAERITKYFSSLSSYMPWLDQLSFSIESYNSFPHSSGIASSASSMSALAMCLIDIESNLYSEDFAHSVMRQKASYVARLGSGSASRSVYAGLAAWGECDEIAGSSDIYAVPVIDVDSVFYTFHDDVLIISPEKKSVSSSAGHALMDTNVFASQRYLQAGQNLSTLLDSMKNGDLDSFGKIVEDEALTLHALMMCSDPSYILMKPGTLAVIEKIRAFRKASSQPVFFTLDAGPNVHVIYPHHAYDQVNEFIMNDLLPLTHENRIIKDRVGQGPEKLI